MRRILDWIRVGLLDLRGDVRRFGVLIACLALGTAAIAAVGSVGAGLQATVVNEASVLMGGDLEAIRPDRAAAPWETAYLESLGEVAAVFDANARISAGEQSAFADMIAVAGNYPLLGDVVSPELPPGDKPAVLLDQRDGAWGALVDPLVFDRLAIGLGDRFMLGGREFEVRGTLTALPDGAVRGFRVGLPTLISMEAYEELDYIRQPLPGLLSQFRYKLRLADMSFEDARTAIETQFDDPVWVVRSPRDAAGTLAQYYDMFVRYLLILGLASLLVGGVGVSIAVNTYVGERQRSIATLRSMGATGPRILVHFLTQVGVLAAIGVGLGLLAGALASAVASPLIGQALGIAVPPSVDVPSLLIAAGFGFLSAFAFSYLALVNAQKVSPVQLFRSLGTDLPDLHWRDYLTLSVVVPMAAAVAGIYALALLTTGDLLLVNVFAAGIVVAFLILRAAAWLFQHALKALPESRVTSLRRAVRSIHVPGSTASVVILSLGLGLSMLVVITVLNNNLSNQLTGAVSRDAPSFVATDVFSDEVEAMQEIARTDPDMVGLSTQPSIRARVVRVNGVEARELREISSEVAFLVGVDIPVTWSAAEPAGGEIVAGEWWPADYDGPTLISLQDDLMTLLDLEVGDQIEFDIFSDPVVATIANFRNYSWFNGLNFQIVFSPGEIEEYPGTFHVDIKAAPGADTALERTLAEQLPEIAFIPIGDALNQALEVLGQLAAGVNAVGSLAVLNGLFVLAGTMATGRKRREADAVVQKVLGASRRRVMWEFTLEYTLLGMFAAAVAGVLGIAAAWGITRAALELGFEINPAIILLVIVGAVVLTVAAGALTTWRSLTTSPARYLRTVQ